MCFFFVAQSEDLLTEILLRLPAKPLNRFKCVSKKWHALISNPRFVRRYHISHRFPSSLLLALTPTRSHPRPVLKIIPLTTSHVDAFPLTLLGFLNVPDLGLYVKQSCNGLLLVQGSKAETTHYFVCNPITKRFVAFQKSGAHYLVYDPLRSSHFKVVSVGCVFNRVQALFSYDVIIYSSETASWSDAEVCFSTPSPPFSNTAASSGVYCNGAIHWYGEPNNCLYFDVENRCFKSYPMPPNIGNHVVEYFGESRGHLHMILKSPELFLFDIWELEQDYSVWLVRFRVDISTPMRVSFPDMNLHLENVIRSFKVWCIVREEKDQDSKLVFFVDDRVLSYNLVDATIQELSEFPSHAGKPNFRGYFKLFEFLENLSCVGGFTV